MKGTKPDPPRVLEPLCHRAGTRIVYDTARPGGLACECATCRRILFRIPIVQVSPGGLGHLVSKR